MKKLSVFIIIAVTLPPLLGRGRQGERLLLLNNHSQTERIDEAFIIKYKDFTSVEKGKFPALTDETGAYIPSQVDDFDKDGIWDELSFVYSLKPEEKVELNIVWLSPEDYPQFEPRTNVRYGKMISPGNVIILNTDAHDKFNLARGKDYPYQTDGPAWENDKMGFRHYFDGRNVRDVFGKRTAKMVMDTVGIRVDGTPGDTYHELHWWGRDIMSGARSTGLGGIALNTPDRLVRLGVAIEETTDNIDSTRYTLITNGPVRSVFRLDFYGWDINGGKVDVHETMTIWAGKYGYENVITTSGLPEGTNLVTGIVNNFNDMPYTLEKVGNYMMMSTHDKQTYDKVWYMGMSLLIGNDNYVDTFEAPETGTGITTAWCANLKPDKENQYHFNCYAAWELTDKNFTDRNYYEGLIRGCAMELSDKIIPEIK